MSSEMIHVEVVYALPHEQRVLKLVVEQSATVEEIIRTSGILQMYPEIDLSVNKVGIFSRNVKLDAKVRDKIGSRFIAHYWLTRKRFAVNVRSKPKLPLVKVNVAAEESTPKRKGL